MSALEQTPPPISPSRADERRNAARIPVANRVSVVVGRGSGILIDLALHGARVRHSEQVQRGTNLRLSFEWHGERFVSIAEVLASRVVALNAGTLPTQYESRLRFRLLTSSATQLLQRVIDALTQEPLFSA